MAATDDFTLIATYRTAAIAAILDGDYSTAISNALAAQLVLSTIPSGMTRSHGTGGGSQQVSWSAADIDTFITRCNQLQAASYGVRRGNIVHQRAGTSTLSEEDI